jgi:hypothetical protein
MSDTMGFTVYTSSALTSDFTSAGVSKSSSSAHLLLPHESVSSCAASSAGSREITPEPLAVYQAHQRHAHMQMHASVSEDEALYATPSEVAPTQSTNHTAPGSAGSVASVGSLNAAVESLHASGAVESPVNDLASASAPALVRSLSASSSTSSSSSRNANNKRSRAEIDAEIGEVQVAGQQLKTSSSAAASSTQACAQAEAQQAHSQREAAAGPEASAAASAAVAPVSTLAPNTPKRQALISVLACVLAQLFSNPNDTLPSDPRLLTRFHTERLPSISIGSYLERIAHYSECSDESLVMAFIHISRVSHNKPHFHLNALSIHRLLLTAIMTTVKFYDDAYYNNAFFAKIGGVQLREMNALEIDFLELIQFELYIDSKVYCRFYEELRNPVLHPKCVCAFERSTCSAHMRETACLWSVGLWLTACVCPSVCPSVVDLNLEEMENPPQI